MNNIHVLKKFIVQIDVLRKFIVQPAWLTEKVNIVLKQQNAKPALINTTHVVVNYRNL